MPAWLQRYCARATNFQGARSSARMRTACRVGLLTAESTSSLPSSCSEITRLRTKYRPSLSMVTKISVGLAVSGIASLPAGSCTGKSRSSLAKFVITMKKMSRLNTMSIMGVRSSRLLARPLLS